MISRFLVPSDLITEELADETAKAVEELFGEPESTPPFPSFDHPFLPGLEALSTTTAAFIFHN